MTTLRQLAPRPVKQAAKQGIGAAKALRSRAELLALKRQYRRRFGPGLIYRVHPDDEMFHFMRDFWSWEHHVVPMKAPTDAMKTYLVSGDGMLRDLEQVLGDHGRDLAKVGSFLEFAAGYGRFTRFLVTRVDPSKVTVADISRPAVDFSKATFGIDGFYSTESAHALDHQHQYEVIFVASLFSHLAIEHWTDWLRRLYDLLAPGGLLVFSTHGPYARDVIFGDYFADRIEVMADGFSFIRSNETEGRLAVDYYGSAFQTEDFVRRQVAEHGLGIVRRVYPNKLWGSQDIYVLEKPAP